MHTSGVPTTPEVLHTELCAIRNPGYGTTSVRPYKRCHHLNVFHVLWYVGRWPHMRGKHGLEVNRTTTHPTFPLVTHSFVQTNFTCICLYAATASADVLSSAADCMAADLKRAGPTGPGCSHRTLYVLCMNSAWHCDYSSIFFLSYHNIHNKHTRSP